MRRLEPDEATPGWVSALLAPGPDPTLEAGPGPLAWLAGDWEILEARYPTSGAPDEVRRGEVHAGWVLGGSALQDVWLTRNEATGELVPAGTTLRFHDHRLARWRSLWLSPRQGTVQLFDMREAGDEILLEPAHEEDGERWVFSDVDDDAFRWRAESSRDGGASWHVTETMRVRRLHRGGP